MDTEKLEENLNWLFKWYPLETKVVFEARLRNDGSILYGFTFTNRKCFLSAPDTINYGTYGLGHNTPMLSVNNYYFYT